MMPPCNTIYALTAALTIVMVGEVAGQSYPHKPIRFVVPYSPGGPTDTVSRLIGQKLGETPGWQVIIDNRGGGSGIIGTELVARAAPDGYTMLLGSFAFAINPVLVKDLPYDTLKDFAPVSLLTQGVIALVVHPGVQASSVKELIALAKSRPAALNYSTTGGGASSHLGALLFQSMTGIKMTAVNYSGAGPGSLAVLTGEVHLSFHSIVPAIPFIKTGKLRVLGVSSAKRTNLLPDVPTIAEAGVPGYQVTQWYGILLPGRTSPPVISRLNQEIVRVVERVDVKENLIAQGLEPAPSSPAEFSRYISTEVTKWTRVLKEFGS
jgi:tripartite-type tricarboxylate transporter receptor subunit TctC